MSHIDMSTWTAPSLGTITALGTVLRTFKPPKNINASVDFSGCVALSEDSIRAIINNLAKVTESRTIKFPGHANTILTSNVILQINNKGWTIG